jgi:hypothetical protein
MIHFTVLEGTDAFIQNNPSIYIVKLFAFAFKFTAKILVGAVGRLMDYSICRHQMSSLYVLQYTIPYLE